MIKEIKNEVVLVADSEQVKDKLMFLSLYNEFFNMVCENLRTDTIDFYERDFNDIFKSTMESLELYPLKRETFDAISLLGQFIQSLERKRTDRSLFGFKYTIPDYVKENLAKLSLEKKHIGIIDAYDDLALAEKADIALTVDEYVRLIKSHCKSFYDEEYAENLSASMYDNICEKLPEFIDENKHLDDIEMFNKLTKYLKNTTKDYLAEKYKSKEIDFLENVNDTYTECLFPKITESNRAIASVFTIYALAGIQSNDPKEKKEIRKEAAELAGTSTFQVSKYAFKTLGKVGKTLLTQKIRR